MLYRYACDKWKIPTNEKGVDCRKRQDTLIFYRYTLIGRFVSGNPFSTWSEKSGLDIVGRFHLKAGYQNEKRGVEK